MDRKLFRQEIDRVIAAGPFCDTWESLSQYKIPQWYKDAKFGIFIHWGVYSVPAFGSEWYPRYMYMKGTPEYEHHRKTYGDQKHFGYKDFIPLFKAEHFDAEKWLDLFEESGAKYIMPVAEHHDGFQMYASGLSHWNASEMGPHRDVIGELKAAAEKRGMVFCVSDHRAEHCWFFNGGLKCDSDVTDPENQSFYGKQVAGIDCEEKMYDIHVYPPDEAHLEDWLLRTCELVDLYQPRIVWFDFWINNIPFRPYLRKFAAYYYNRAAQWGAEVAINYKYSAYMLGSAVFDVERGQLDCIRPDLWQTDTAAARNSWGYTERNDFKEPAGLVCDLVDIVSKNGCLLLNIGPKPDGTITEEDAAILRSIGSWLKRNGEGIYGATYWERYGEGPTRITEGAFTDTRRTPYTSQDIRFTFKPGAIYAFVMKYPENGVVKISSIARKRCSEAEPNILGVSMLSGQVPVRYSLDDQGLTVYGEPLTTDYPVGFKISIE